MVLLLQKITQDEKEIERNGNTNLNSKAVSTSEGTGSPSQYCGETKLLVILLPLPTSSAGQEATAFYYQNGNSKVLEIHLEISNGSYITGLIPFPSLLASPVNK